MAAIAIPQYGAYANRARVTDAISLMGAWKTAVSEFIGTTGGTCDAATAELILGVGAAIPEYASTNVREVTWGTPEAGVIRATMQAAGGGGRDGATVTLGCRVVGQTIQWLCGSSLFPDDANMVPVQCRGDENRRPAGAGGGAVS
ncbi:pilin [Gammaproteobacteria bacterium]|nr:pilin [Gammaproteobacteria bacterium]